MTHYNIARLDASDEKSNTSMKTVDLAADGLNWPAILAGLATLQTAVDGVTDGSAYQETIVASTERLTNVVPEDDSRRETKWLFSYEDDVDFSIHEFSLPCADWTNVNRAGTTDFWDLGDETAGMTAMRLAIENLGRSPLGNTVTLLSVEDVGRNN